MKCLSEERLIELIEDGAPESLEEEHLAACHACSQTLQELRQGSELLSEFRPAAAPSQPIPTLTFGDYEKCREIACGAMSRVYLSRAPDGRQVAVKVCRDQALLDSFSNEIKMLQRCQSAGVPHILPLLDARLDHLPAFIVTPYFAAGNLSRALQSRPPQDIPVLPFAMALARSLAALAELGIVHGDLKASNILIDAAGIPCLADLGGARRVVTPGQSSTLSVQGLGHMSLISMSPEQARGQSLSPASDVFSFGIILYQLACGRHPFDGGTSWEMAAKILSEAAPDPRPWLKPELRGRFAALLEACLSKDPAQRPTARKIVADLPHILRPLDTLSRVSKAMKTPGAPLAKSTKAKPSRKVALILALALLVALISYAASFHSGKNSAPAKEGASVADKLVGTIKTDGGTEAPRLQKSPEAKTAFKARPRSSAAAPFPADKGRFEPSPEESENFENAVLSMFMYDLASCHYLYQNTELSKDELKAYATIVIKKSKIKSDKDLSEIQKSEAIHSLELDVIAVLGESNYQILNNYRENYEGHKVLSLLDIEFADTDNEKKQRFVRDVTDEIAQLRLDRSDDRKYFSKELWDKLINKSRIYMNDDEIKALDSLGQSILKANRKTIPAVLTGED